MKPKIREQILAECKDGEIKSFHKSNVKLSSIWKGIIYGVTKDNFPFLAFETTNFGTIVVGNNRFGMEPKSKIRNDADGSIDMKDNASIVSSAERMSKEIVYRKS